MDKSERYLKDIAKSLQAVEKNTAEIARELKKQGRKPTIDERTTEIADAIKSRQIDHRRE
ncbi:hypothetical protein GCM10022378_11560 [Salinicoccus jeotgali]|uniref:Uncharacterized protein n=1 Tax=Salinicoccus jeotgali TaxID=381634 RepID=A0ABP7EW31_9STAP